MVAAEIKRFSMTSFSPSADAQRSTESDTGGKLSEEELSLRWRTAILRLSANLQTAAEQRSYLTPVLLEALNYALNQLLQHGNDYYIEQLEEWLDYEESSSVNAQERRSGSDRRLMQERRSGQERRQS